MMNGRGKVLCQGEKQIGKNRGWINIKEDSCEIVIGIDLRQIDQWYTIICK